MTNRAVISIGSNIEKEKNLPTAIRLLGEACQITAVSSIYESEAVIKGPHPENLPRFWNAAVLIDTDLDPVKLKKTVLTPIEKKLKRVRTSDKYAPRTIDLDLILFDDEILDLDENHHIPDPDLATQIHVAIPVAELLPNKRHPETGQTFAAIAQDLGAARVSENILLKKISNVDTDQLIR